MAATGVVDMTARHADHLKHILYPSIQHSVVADLHPGSVSLPYMATRDEASRINHNRDF